MGNFLVDNKELYSIQLNFVIGIVIVMKVLIMIYIFFLSKNEDVTNFIEKLLFDMNTILKTFIGLFLIYRFNIWTNDKIKFTDLDRRICFSAGLAILIITINDYMINHKDEIRGYLPNNTYVNIGS